jgi:hypothetical protein
MLVYTLVAGDGGARLPDEMPTRLARIRPRGVPVDAGRRMQWANDRGSVAVAAWQDRDEPFGVGARWHQDAAGMTAVVGVPIPRLGPWEADAPWAHQLAQRLRSRRVDELMHELLGTFTILTLDADGRGAVVSDPLGVSLVYAARGDGFTVLSNRADVAAEVTASSARPVRDPVGACWLAFSPYPIEDRTGYAQVRVGPARAMAKVDPHEGLRFESVAAAPWEGRNTAEGRVPADTLDAIYAEMAASVRAAPNLRADDHLVELTGGKDSRLVFATLLAEGLTERFRFRTSGREDLPDVAVARRIASEFDLRYTPGQRDPWQMAQRTARNDALRARGFTEPERELVMRLNVGSWSGMRSVAEPLVGGSADGSRLVLSGLCGECLRTNFPRTRRVRSMGELDDLLTAQFEWGQAGLIRPETRTHYEDISREVLLEGFGGDDLPQDAIDAFYIRTRIRRWFGTSQEADPSGRIFPLYSPAGIAAAFAIGARERRAERLHYELIRRASEPLARIPFEKDGWDDALHAGPPPIPASRGATVRAQPGREVRRPSSSAGAQPARTVGRDRRRRLQEQDREVMRKFLVQDRENPVFEVLDRPAVIDAVDRFGDLSEPAKLQLYGALTAAIWLGEHEIDLASGRQGVAPPAGADD